jgi:hypothetical protein
LKLDAIFAAYSVEKSQSVTVTPHKQVLSIVYHVTCLGIDERIGTTAESISLFEQQYVETEVGQDCPGRKSAETASDDHNARTHYDLLNLLLSQI